MKVELYEPSNGTEFDSFSAQFCNKCAKMPIDSNAKHQCMILGRMFMHDKSDKEYPNQMRYVDGKPACTAFVSREEANKKRRANKRSRPKPKPKDELTLSLF